MRKISVILGTRPEAIKLAPLILALKNQSDIITKVCVTGQHRQMLDQVLEVFDIGPDVDLDLMSDNQTLSGFTAKALVALDKYLDQEKPDLILVQGDTTTVLCASLSAFYHKISIGHVEAGLRTGDIYSPWPEEANRILVSKLASIHFAPTELNKNNLLKEGVPESKIFVTGNTVIDALFIALEKINSQGPTIRGLPDNSLEFLGNKKMVLITGHRRENFGKGFENICGAIKELATKFPDVHFIYPVHLNPYVQEPVYRILETNISDSRNCKQNIHLIEPQDYLQFIALMNRSYLILTDSGGVQEEAPSLRKPVLVMRDTTERMEVIESGSGILVGTIKSKIIEKVDLLLTNSQKYSLAQSPKNPYGNGDAAGKILIAIKNFIN